MSNGVVLDDEFNIRCYRKLIELEKQTDILLKKPNQGDDK